MPTTVDDETILEVLRSNDAPRMTTTEVAGHLPVTRGTTRTRLQRLVDDDLLERKTEGNNVVWWLPERADELDAWEAADTDATDGGDVADAEADGESEAAESAVDETGEADEDTQEAVDETEEEPEAEPEDTTVEVEPTEQAKAEADDTAVEVEAVENDGIDEDVTTPDQAAETRTVTDRPELSEDEEGLRALALLAAVVALFLLLRKLRGRSDEATD